MNGRTVTVKIELPRLLHGFMKKVADLEGSNAEEWYEMFLRDGFKAFLGTLRKTPIDLDPTFFDTIYNPNQDVVMQSYEELRINE
ncbi:MAG: hypothetical protein ABSD49_07960 [Candidatus Bathyarchaeia archaeon]